MEDDTKTVVLVLALAGLALFRNFGPAATQDKNTLENSGLHIGLATDHNRTVDCAAPGQPDDFKLLSEFSATTPSGQTLCAYVCNPGTADQKIRTAPGCDPLSTGLSYLSRRSYKDVLKR